MKDKIRTLLKLFFETFRLSLFTIGGGYVIIGLLKDIFVDKLHWLTEDEMLDYTALAQSCPGAIAINASVLVGYRVASFTGIIASLLGTILPPMILISIIAYFYDFFVSFPVIQFALKGMEAAVAALMLNTIINSCGKIILSKDIFAIILMVISFIAVFFININAAIVLVLCGVIGVSFFYFSKYLKKRKENKK